MVHPRDVLKTECIDGCKDEYCSQCEYYELSQAVKQCNKYIGVLRYVAVDKLDPQVGGPITVADYNGVETEIA